MMFFGSRIPIPPLIPFLYFVHPFPFETILHICPLDFDFNCDKLIVRIHFKTYLLFALLQKFSANLSLKSLSVLMTPKIASNKKLPTAPTAQLPVKKVLKSKDHQ